MDLTLLVLASNGVPPERAQDLEKLGIDLELLVSPPNPGYGKALMNGFARARGEHVLTVDAYSELEASLVARLWNTRKEAEIVIASELVRGGASDAGPRPRAPFTNRLVNRLYRRALDLPIYDFTSGCRLYARSALRQVSPEAADVAILPELLVRCYAEGYKIKHVPRDRPPERCESRSRDLSALLRALPRLRRLRWSLSSADVDDRAFESRTPLRSRWLRRRQETIVSYLEAEVPVLDVGCGSSRLIQALAKGVGLDRDLKKLRYLRGRAPAVVAGDLTELPFRDESFPQLVCSDVLGHVPEGREYLSELRRVLRPGGTLVVGTPDVRSLSFRMLRPLGGLIGPSLGTPANAYNEGRLKRELEESGFAIDEIRRVGRAEMIVRAIRR